MKRDYSTYDRKEIDYEDDFVIVFDGEDNQIYKGIEDYEPMKDVDWVWDSVDKIYKYQQYTKICVNV